MPLENILMVQRFILICYLLSVVIPAFGQFGHYHYYGNNSKSDKKVAERAYFGIEYPRMNLDMTQSYAIDRSTLPVSIPPSTGLPSVDTTIYISKKNSSKLGLKGALGIVGGTSFNLARLSETSMLALDVSASVEIYNWSVGIVKYSTVDSSVDPVFLVVERLPIALMYKTGCEASLSSANKLIFGIGGGIAPSFGESVYEQNSGGFFKFSPFLTAELGAWIGLGVKFRAAYYPGTYTFINASGNDLPAYTTNGNLTLLANGGSNFVFSFVLLLNSHQWDDGGY